MENDVRVDKSESAGFMLNQFEEIEHQQVGENFRYIPSIIFSTHPQVVKSPFTTSIKLHRGYIYIQYIVAVHIYIYTYIFMAMLPNSDLFVAKQPCLSAFDFTI